MFAAQMHGTLQNAEAALINLKGVLTSPQIEMKRLRRAGLPADLTLDMDDVVLPGDPLQVRARISEGNPRIDVQLTNTTTNEVLNEQLVPDRATGWHEGLYKVTPGTWRVTISAPDASPVTDLAVVAAS